MKVLLTGSAGFIASFVARRLLERGDEVVGLDNINGYYDRMKALLEHTADEKFMDREILDLCRFMEDPEEILNYIENYKR